VTFVNWQRAATLRVPVLMLLALTSVVAGVSVGVFMLSVPAGWIVAGVLTGCALGFLAYVAEPEVTDGRAALRR
jgi:hypothetical protein